MPKGILFWIAYEAVCLLDRKNALTALLIPACKRPFPFFPLEYIIKETLIKSQSQTLQEFLCIASS